ncbi:MAG: SGNH/GDSL hydrolase family protein [Verrucomicrobiae bacterium]|nr:SGNH/GDSL hydrolase family protein [Verrucomicrobiae bacterium]
MIPSPARLICLLFLLFSGFPLFGGTTYQRVLFLGNSITKHGPKADIDWTGDWGMAASSAEKDYVHLVISGLATRNGTHPEVRVRNIADFERSHADYDVAGKLGEFIDFHPDLIILAIGENVPAPKDDSAVTTFRNEVIRLLKTIQGDTGATIVVRSGFWANEAKDRALAEASSSVGGVFVDLSALSKDESLYARSEREFKHAGVANHPGDKGMAAIASAILAALPQ